MQQNYKLCKKLDINEIFRLRSHNNKKQEGVE